MMTNRLKNKVLFFLLLMTLGVAGCLTVANPQHGSLNERDTVVPAKKELSKGGGLFVTDTPSCEINPSLCENKQSKPVDCWSKPKKGNVFILAMGADTDGLLLTNQDAKKFANAMRELFQVHEDQVCFLENASKSEFTRALKRLSDDQLVDANDLVIIYFSGHGTQTSDDKKGEEGDCLDEMFVAYPKGDETESEVRDDDFAKLMEAIDDRTHNILTVIDACFSAGFNRSRDEVSSERVKYRKSRESSAKRCAPYHISAEMDPVKGVLLSAATESQRAVELHGQCDKTGDKEKEMWGGAIHSVLFKNLGRGCNTEETRWNPSGFVNRV